MDVIIYLFDFILSLSSFSVYSILIDFVVLVTALFFAFKVIDMLT